MRRKSVMLIAWIGIWLTPLAFIESQETGGQEYRRQSGEEFSLYGYLINYFQSSFNYLGDSFSQPQYGDALLLRLKGDWRPENHVRFHLESTYLMNTGNQNPYVLMHRLGLNPFLQSDFPFYDFNRLWIIDHAWGLVSLGMLDLQFGQFPLAWGTGYVFNPTARVSFPPFLDMVTEDTPGVLASQLTWTLSDRLALQAYLAFQDRTHKKTAYAEDGQAVNLPYGIKLKTIFGSFDLSACWFREVLYSERETRPLDQILEQTARQYLNELLFSQTLIDLLAAGDTAAVIHGLKNAALAGMMTGTISHPGYRQTCYLGGDLAGAIGNFGVYTELALSIPSQNGRPVRNFSGYRIRNHLEAVAGFDYTIDALDLETRGEYFFQGGGVKRKSEYDLLTLFSGERLVMARHYGMLMAERTFRDSHRLTAACFINFNDGSLALLPAYNYQRYDNFELTAGLFFLDGSRGAEFDGRYTIMGVREIDLIDDWMPYIRLKLSF